MEELTSFASVPAIMAIVWLAAAAWDWSISDMDGKPLSKKAEAFKPILAGTIGLFLGVVTFFTNPEVIHSDNVLAAGANGLISGLAAVGIRNFTKKKAD